MLAVAPAVTATEARTLTVTGPVRFVPIADTALAESNAARYRGILEVSIAPNGGISLINEVGFEDYLKGIAEVPGRWPAEALKAQAIAARTYVLWELSRGRSPEGRQLGYDICATIACQVYRGLDNETGPSGQAWTDAVESTRSVAVTHEGKPILARYHSTSGGRTRNNEDVFTSDGPRPYLVAVESPYEQGSPLSRWQTVFARSQIEEILNDQKEISLKGSLIDIRFIKHPDGSGKPNELRVVGSEGETIVRAATFSRVVSREARSRWPDQYPPLNPALPGARLPDAIPSSNFTVELSGDRIVINGSGWGHGVGMSQYGALGMAEEGMLAEQILTHFYRNTRVEVVPEPDVVRVGLGTGAPEISVEGSGEFRIESPGGKVLVERALGRFTVKPGSGNALSLRYPDGAGERLVLQTLELSRTGSSDEMTSLSASFEVSGPARVRYRIEEKMDRHLVYESDQLIVEKGRASLSWNVTDSAGRRPPGGEYLFVLKASSPTGEQELISEFVIESEWTPENSPDSSIGVFITLGLAALAIVLMLAGTLKRRKAGARRL